MGGWIAMAGYCSSGLNPLPSGTATISLSVASIWNGLAMKLLRSRKKASTVVSTATTNGIMSRCLRRFVNATTMA